MPSCAPCSGPMAFWPPSPRFSVSSVVSVPKACGRYGQQRGGFIIGMGHGKEDARDHARFVNGFECVRDALAAARRGLLLLRGHSEQE